MKMLSRGPIPSNVAENNNGGHTYALSHVSPIEYDEHDEGQALKRHFEPYKVCECYLIRFACSPISTN